MTTGTSTSSPTHPGPMPALFLLALLLLGAGCRASDAPLILEKGRVDFISSYGPLQEGFHWAKAQALAYSFEGDHVGKWFEAALPGREAFCMRDVSHQALGAMVLGLQDHAENMFRKFAANISASRDWASYWEINRYDRPAPVDYRSDEDFWYNLPANFDLIQSMYRVYEWTGDPEYLEDPVFLAFYHHSLTDYVATWDRDGDGIMESLPENGIRGIPTYWEGGGPRAAAGADLMAAQFAGNRDYARILRLRGEEETAEAFETAAVRLRRLYNEVWWNADEERFYTAILPDGSFDDSPLPLGQLYPLYFGVVEPGPRREKMVAELPDGGMVELDAYLPEILYLNGAYDRAFRALMAQLDPSLERREYPEVSFTALGHIVGSLMGVRPRASEGVVETKSRLTDKVRWTEISHLPVFNNEIMIGHDGRLSSHLRNEFGPRLTWRAVFQGTHWTLVVNGEERQAVHRVAPGEGRESWVEVDVGPGEEVVVGVRQRS